MEQRCSTWLACGIFSRGENISLDISGGEKSLALNGLELLPPEYFKF